MHEVNYDFRIKSFSIFKANSVFRFVKIANWLHSFGSQHINGWNFFGFQICKLCVFLLFFWLSFSLFEASFQKFEQRNANLAFFFYPPPPTKKRQKPSEKVEPGSHCLSCLLGLALAMCAAISRKTRCHQRSPSCWFTVCLVYA